MESTIMPKTVRNGKSFWLLLISLILILSGVYVLFNPITALVASAMVVGVVFILLGVGYLMAFREKKSSVFLALGVLDLIIGVLFLSNIGISAANMPIILGLWILFNGIAEIVMGWEMRSDQDSMWKIFFFGGILGVIFSLLIFAMPVIGVVTITVVIGLYLIIYGALEFMRFMKAY